MEIPTKPTNFFVEVLNETCLRITWDLQTCATSYSLYRSESLAGEYSLITPINLSPRMKDDITVITGTEYFYKVILHNIDGESSEVSDVLSSVPMVVGPPVAPIVTMRNKTTTEVALSWGDAENANGPSVAYLSDSAEGTFNVVPSSYKYCRMWDLTPNTTYYFKVQASSGVYSEVFSFTTYEIPTVVPNAPTGLTLTKNDFGELEFIWNLSEDVAIESLVAEMSLDGASWPETTDEGGTVTYDQGTNEFGEYMIYNLGGPYPSLQFYGNTDSYRHGATYFWRVFAVNDAGRSLPSEVLQFTTMALPISAPAPKDLYINSDPTSNQIVLCWTTNGNAFQSDTLLVSTAENGVYEVATLEFDIQGGGVAWAVGLLPETTYYFKVQGFFGEFSNIVSGTTSKAIVAVYPAPANLTVVSLGRTLLISFDKAPGRVVQYNVWRCDTVDGEYSQASAIGPYVDPRSVYAEYARIELEDKYIDLDSTYFYKVTNVNDIGESEFSEVASGTTSTTVPEIPPFTPYEFSASDWDNLEVSLNWASSPLFTDYVILCSRTVDGEFVELTGPWSYRDNSGASYSVDSPGVYYYKVIATNAFGSSTTDIVRLVVALPLSVPRNVTVTPISETSLNISWDSVEYAQAYIVSKDTGDIFSDIWSGPETEVVDENLSAGPHSYKVKSYDGYSLSMSSFAIVGSLGSGSYGFSGVVRFGNVVAKDVTVVLWDITDNVVGATTVSDSNGVYSVSDLLVDHEYLLTGYKLNGAASFSSFSRVIGRPVLV